MRRRRPSEMSDEELIREARALYAHLVGGEETFTLEDLYYFERLVEELERRGYTIVEAAVFVEEGREDGAEEQEGDYEGDGCPDCG